jgi:hypothetical protein
MNPTLRRAQALVCTAWLMHGAIADAHEMACEQTVSDRSLLAVNGFPTTLRFRFTILNTSAADEAVALTVTDGLFAPLGFSFTPAPPLHVGIGMSVQDGFDLVVSTPEACRRLAAADGEADDNIDNVLVVTSDTGAAACVARVVCPPASLPTGASRTMGFYKTHEAALSACLGWGAIDLGLMTVSTLSEALGILWGSPLRFADGTRRSTLDQQRFLLSRQTLTALCNQRLFGAASTPSTLLGQAVAALAGTECSLLASLESEVDALNNAGDAVALPSGFVPGPATPRDAQARAVDPTRPSNRSCNP